MTSHARSSSRLRPAGTPVTVGVKLGARRDGTLTAMQLNVVADAGAYGNHSPASCSTARTKRFRSIAPQQEGGRRRGLYQYDAERRISRLRAEPDHLRGGKRAGRTGADAGLDPFALRRLNVVGPGDALRSYSDHPHDVEMGSYGLDQCLDLVSRRSRGMRASRPPARIG